MRGRIPDWASIILANMFAIAGAILFLQGFRRFRGLRILWWPECLLGGAAIAFVVWFRYVADNINIRILAMSLAMGSMGIACGITLLKEIPRRRRLGSILTGIIFTIGGVAHLSRGIYVIAVAPVSNLMDSASSNSLLFLAAALGLVSWSFGFIMLTAEPFGDIPGRTPEPPDAQMQDAVPDAKVRQQLQKILESDVFRRSAQMERFLTLAVDRALSGRPEELKEYSLGREVFHRGENYDPRTDPIVRVEAQRLRRKLREYYESQGREDTVVITLPPGGYVPEFGYIQPTSSRLP